MAAYLISFLPVFLFTWCINTDKTCLLRLRYLWCFGYGTLFFRFCFAFSFAFDVWFKFQFANAIVEGFWDCWSCFGFFIFWKKDSFITHQDFYDALAKVSARAQTQPVVNPNSKSDTKIQAVDDRGQSYSSSWLFKNLLNSKPWPLHRFDSLSCIYCPSCIIFYLATIINLSDNKCITIY